MFKALTYFLLILILSSLLSSCAAIDSDNATPAIRHVDPQQSRELIIENTGNKDFVILDVRTPGEYSQGYIADARNVDVQSPDFIGSLAEFNKNAVYLVYCRSGNRSVTAGNLMLQAGFTTVYNMTGGINEWLSLGYPVVK